MQKRIWITWELQRRSIELARKLSCELFIIEYRGGLRFPLSIFKTIRICIKTKPDVLFVQNPSMLLAFTGCIYCFISKIPLVVDRHSNFLLTQKKRNMFYVIIFKILNFITIQYANITIVTNSYLANIIKKYGGVPFVLPDKIPLLRKTNSIELEGYRKILVIASFHLDEPIGEVIRAADQIKDRGIFLYITGNYKEFDKSKIKNAPKNVVFTGFLEEDKFIDMLFSVDAIIVLTKIDYCMLCGCYEAVAAEKPLITSKKKVLQDYFKGAYFVKNNSNDIANGILYIVDNLTLYRNNIISLKKSLIPIWENQFDKLNYIIDKLK